MSQALRTTKNRSVRFGFLLRILAELLQLRFFVDHVLASNRVVFAHFHFATLITFVLSGCIEVAGSSAGYQFDFFTNTFRHGELLRLDFAAGAKVR